MNAASILNYVAWHLGIRPEHPISPARITYAGAQREKATPTSGAPADAAATGEADGEQGRP
jgi:hypothetical protein